MLAVLVVLVLVSVVLVLVSVVQAMNLHRLNHHHQVLVLLAVMKPHWLPVVQVQAVTNLHRFPAVLDLVVMLPLFLVALLT